MRPRRYPVTHGLPPTQPDTTYAAAQAGNVTGSGEVAPWNQLQPYGGAGISAIAPRVIGQGNPDIPQLPGQSLYQDRPLYGGVSTFPAFGQFRRPPSFAGGFTLMAHRPPLALLEGQQMQPQQFATDATWREASSIVNLCQRTPSELTGNG